MDGEGGGTRGTEVIQLGGESGPAGVWEARSIPTVLTLLLRNFSVQQGSEARRAATVGQVPFLKQGYLLSAIGPRVCLTPFLCSACLPVFLAHLFVHLSWGNGC